MNHKISVIIAAHTDDSFILVLRALKAQTYQPFQIIISDNANGSFKRIADEFGCDYISSEIPSRSAARNVGFPLVKGDLTVFLDEDMIPAVNMFELFNGWYDREEKYNTTVNSWGQEVIVGMDWHNIPSIGFELMINMRQQGYFRQLKGFRLPSNCFCGMTSLFQREMDEEGYIFDENFIGYGEEDIEFFYRIKLKGAKLFYCTEALVFHKRHLIDIEKNTRTAIKNIGYFLKKYNDADDIINESKQVWEDCYGYIANELPITQKTI